MSIILYPYFWIFNYYVYLFFPYNSVHLLRSFSLFPLIRWALSLPLEANPFGNFGFHTSYGRHDEERKPYALGCCLFGPFVNCIINTPVVNLQIFLTKITYTHIQTILIFLCDFMCGVIQGETQLYFLRFSILIAWLILRWAK